MPKQQHRVAIELSPEDACALAGAMILDNPPDSVEFDLAKKILSVANKVRKNQRLPLPVKERLRLIQEANIRPLTYAHRQRNPIMHTIKVDLG